MARTLCNVTFVDEYHGVQGDQASIVAGAINFVKELEQLLQSLEAQKRRAGCTERTPPASSRSLSTRPARPVLSARAIVLAALRAAIRAAAAARGRAAAWPTSRWPWRTATPT